MTLRGVLSGFVGLAVALALSDCGLASPVSVPRGIGSGPPRGGATFGIDGETISVTQPGSISVSVKGVPQLTYSGPLGCKGRYFTANYADHIKVLFRYSSRDAYMAIASDLYHFPAAPRHKGGTLVWDQDFADRHITVSVGCPVPPPSGPLDPVAGVNGGSTAGAASPIPAPPGVTKVQREAACVKKAQGDITKVRACVTS